MPPSGPFRTECLRPVDITVSAADWGEHEGAAAVLVFEYMAVTLAETGRPTPAGAGELPPVLQGAGYHTYSVIIDRTSPADEQIPAAPGCRSAAAARLSRRRFDDWITTTTVSRDAARRLGDRGNEGIALGNLGIALAQVRRFEEAIRGLVV
jgi:hypothetical protein